MDSMECPCGREVIDKQYNVSKQPLNRCTAFQIKNDKRQVLNGHSFSSKHFKRQKCLMLSIFAPIQFTYEHYHFLSNPNHGNLLLIIQQLILLFENPFSHGQFDKTDFQRSLELYEIHNNSNNKTYVYNMVDDIPPGLVAIHINIYIQIII